MKPASNSAAVLCAVFCVVALLAGVSSAQEEVAEDVVRNEEWGVEFSALNYHTWTEHESRGQPNFVAAGAWQTIDCGFNLSLFAVLVAEGTPAAECRAGLAGNPSALADDETVSGLIRKDGILASSRFDRVYQEDLLRHHLYGYQVEGETCFELHVSAIACEAFDAVAQPILGSLEIKPRSGVNVETVAVARSLGIEPDHWRVHQVIAAEYLHNTQPTNPERARRYYRSALALAPDDLPFEEEWTIHDGIGMSWLSQDEGHAAIGPFTKAAELARSAPTATMELGQSLYNLACAHSLAGDRARACEVATEIVSPIAEEAKQAMLRLMRQDPMLEGLREAGCIDGL